MKNRSVVVKGGKVLICAVALVALPFPAVGQEAPKESSVRTESTTVRTQHEKEFPWGLLGLLGLGGLLGLKRRTSGSKDAMRSLPSDFDPQGYLRLNPDVERAGFDPREHYVRHGRHEGRRYGR